jgi:hypothetical protein
LPRTSREKNGRNGHDQKTERLDKAELSSLSAQTKRMPLRYNQRLGDLSTLLALAFTLNNLCAEQKDGAVWALNDPKDWL